MDFFEKFFAGFAALAIVLWAAFWVTVFIVAFHFIGKVW